MKIGNLFLRDWVYCNPHQWARYEDERLPVGNILLIKDYKQSNGIWIPIFNGEFQYLDKIYKNINPIIFEYNQEKAAMKYVDEFLIRINNLMMFK